MEVLLKKFDELRAEEKWIKAAKVEMVLIDKYTDIEQLKSVFTRVHYIERKRKKLEKRGEKDRKVAHWIGLLKKWGLGGYEKNYEGAYA